MDDWQEFRVSNDALDDAPELRRRLDDEGYLFFRDLIDADKLAEVRADVFDVLAANGWLKAGTDPIDGIANLDARCTEGDQPYFGVYAQVQRLESFHRIPHDSDIVETSEKIFDTDVIPVPGHKARIWFPQFTDHTTPMHQDFVHYQGSLDTLTCWAPVGDCPVELGPLAVLEGSHKVKKVLPHHFSLGAGGLIVDLEAERQRYEALSGPWRCTDFRSGDALFFPALTIHRALPNESPDRIRLSLDNRYQREGGNIAEHLLHPHLYEKTKADWDDVYANWTSDEFKYYWRRHDYREVKQNRTMYEEAFVEAMGLAREGDPRALLAVRRFVEANPDADQTPEARAILVGASA